MQPIMIHRPLPTREGRNILAGEYTAGTSLLGGFMVIQTQGKPSLQVGTMTFEQFNKAELEGWLTKIQQPGHQPGCVCTTCVGVRIQVAGQVLPHENPFTTVADIIVTEKGIGALDHNGALVSSVLA